MKYRVLVGNLVLVRAPKYSLDIILKNPEFFDDVDTKFFISPVAADTYMARRAFNDNYTIELVSS